MPPVARLASALPVLAAAAAIVPVRDPDVYWHLALGRAIAETGVPQPPDPLSFTQPGAPFANLTWAWDLGSWGIWQLGGLPGLQGGAAAALAGGLALAIRVGQTGGTAPWAGVAAALGLLGAFGRVFPRPDVVQLILPIAMAWAAEALFFASPGSAARRGAAAAIGIGVVWPHLHGSFPVGCAILAAWCLEAALRRRPLALGCATLGAALLAPALHPSGLLGAYKKVFSQLIRGELPLRVAEWEPADWSQLATLQPGPLHALLLLGIWATLGAVWNRKTTRWALVGVALAYVGLGIRSTRFEGAAAVFAVAAALRGTGGGASPRVPALGLLASGLATAIVLGALGRVPAYGFGFGAARSEKPSPILDTLAAVPGGPRRVLSDFDLGAVIGFSFAPRWTVAMDSRAEAFYTPEVATAYTQAMEGGAGLAAFLERWPADAAVVHRRSGACISLAADATWRSITFTEDFVVFLAADVPGPLGLSALAPCGPPWVNVSRCASTERTPGQEEWRALAVTEATSLATEGDPFLLAQAGLVTRVCGGDVRGLALLDAAVEAAPRDVLLRAARARARKVEGQPGWLDDLEVLDTLAPLEAAQLRALGERRD